MAPPPRCWKTRNCARNTSRSDRRAWRAIVGTGLAPCEHLASNSGWYEPDNSETSLVARAPGVQSTALRGGAGGKGAAGAVGVRPEGDSGNVVKSRASTGRGAAIQRDFGSALSQPNQEKIKAWRRLQPNRRAGGAARRCAAPFGLDSARCRSLQRPLQAKPRTCPAGVTSWRMCPKPSPDIFGRVPQRASRHGARRSRPIHELSMDTHAKERGPCAPFPYSDTVTPSSFSAASGR